MIQMVRTLLKSVREFKRSALLTPVYVVGEVLLEALIPFVIAQLVNQIEAGCGLNVILMYGGILIGLSLFSLLPAFVITGVMDSRIRDVFPSSRAALALMLDTCVMFLGMSVFLRMDMLMCMFIVLALNSFFVAWKGRGDTRLQVWLIPVWTFLALFTKGPVGLLVPPVSILCFLAVKGDLPSAGKFLGWRFWLVLALLCALWFTGVYFDGGRQYLDNLLIHQTVGRAVNSFHHAEPFWYYLTAVWYCLAPYCLLLAGCLATSVAVRRRRSDEEVFFATIVISTLVMLSAFSAKLAIYLAPVFPFMVYLFPFVEKRIGEKPWMKWALAVPAALLVAAALAALAAVLFFRDAAPVSSLLGQYPFASSPWVLAALIVLALCNLFAVILIARRFDWQLPVALMACSLLMACLLCGPVVPEINKYTAYGALCREIPGNTTDRKSVV